MNTMKRFLCLLLSSIITILSLSSCGKLKDFTEEDRHEALWCQFNVNGLYVETVFADAIDLSGLIFVGHVKKAQKNVFHYTENGKQKEDITYRYTMQIDDLWAGETVGKTVTVDSGSLLDYNSLFLDHMGCSYIFILYPSRRIEDIRESNNLYESVFCLETVIPIQPSTGKMYPLIMGYYKELDEFDGQPPEKLKEYIQNLQQQVLEKGYKAAQPDAAFDTLSLIFQPYQTAYETGKPVEFIPYVIQKLIEGPLSAYEEEPYYDALLTRVKKAYNSRKNRWGMTEGKLYSILEEMLPKLADKARKESK